MTGAALKGRPSNNPKGRPRVVYDPALVEAVRVAYTSGMTQEEVAATLNVGRKLVASIMKRHDMPRRPQIKRDQRGPANAYWKGDAACYTALHFRVEKERGKPAYCERCGSSDEPGRWYEWANLTGEYTNINDYERMCRSCHRRYDNARRREVMNHA